MFLGPQSYINYCIKHKPAPLYARLLHLGGVGGVTVVGVVKVVRVVRVVKVVKVVKVVRADTLVYDIVTKISALTN